MRPVPPTSAVLERREPGHTAIQGGCTDTDIYSAQQSGNMQRRLKALLPVILATDCDGQRKAFAEQEGKNERKKVQRVPPGLTLALRK